MTLDEMAADIRRRKAHVEELRRQQQVLGQAVSEAVRELIDKQAEFEELVKDVIHG